MPGFNHTGPNGLGPGTGRKRGKCRTTNPANVSNEMSERMHRFHSIEVVNQSSQCKGRGKKHHGNCQNH